jgi:ribulose kinase
VRTAVTEAEGATPGDIRGLGFDAACSLVVVDETGAPVTVSPPGEERRNVIVWMDHRAAAQAEEINATSHEVLRYVGGTSVPDKNGVDLEIERT